MNTVKRLTTLTALLSFALAVSCVKDTPGVRLQPGESLPEFSTVTLTGQNAGTRTLLGKPSAVILFSTTCPDCHRQLPELESAWKDLGDVVNILAVARNETQTTVSSFWNASGYTMPVAAPGNRNIYDLFDRGSRSGIPLLYLSDAEGTVLTLADDKAVLPAGEIIRTLTQATGKPDLPELEPDKH
jgi:peroxiredoxin